MLNSVASKSALPGLKHFRHEGCFSYLFFDAGTGEALLVDPRADLMEDYREFIAERGLKPVLVIDTRLHWHHLSGSHLFAEAYGVPIAMSSRTASERAARKLAHQEKIKVGAWELTALLTPGVSPDALCLVGAGLLLSGDTAWIGAGARTDLAGGDAAALWHSLREILAPLPGKTVVLPGYDRQDLLFSTIEVEKKRGPDWQAGTQASFVQAKSEEKFERVEGDARRRFEYNRELHPAPSPESHFGGGSAKSGAASDGRGVATISVEKLEPKMKGHSSELCLLDVREVQEFNACHIPGSLCVPLSELPLHLAQLESYKRIYVSCQSGSRSALAARTLDYLGLPDVVHVSGGIRAWENAGLPLE